MNQNTKTSVWTDACLKISIFYSININYFKMRFQVEVSFIYTFFLNSGFNFRFKIYPCHWLGWIWNEWIFFIKKQVVNIISIYLMSCYWSSRLPHMIIPNTGEKQIWCSKWYAGSCRRHIFFFQSFQFHVLSFVTASMKKN